MIEAFTFVVVVIFAVIVAGLVVIGLLAGLALIGSALVVVWSFFDRLRWW